MDDTVYDGHQVVAVDPLSAKIVVGDLASARLRTSLESMRSTTPSAMVLAESGSIHWYLRLDEPVFSTHTARRAAVASP